MQFTSLGYYTKNATLDFLARLDATDRLLPRKGRALFIALPDGRTAFRVTKHGADVYQIERNT